MFWTSALGSLCLGLEFFLAKVEEPFLAVSVWSSWAAYALELIALAYVRELKSLKLENSKFGFERLTLY